MINWNEVTVGETKLTTIDAMLPIYVVIGMSGSEVWCRDIDTFQCTTLSRKSFSAKWTIYDPWEDVSEECSINEWGRVEHNGEIIDFKPNVYKRSEKGLRVWKRKEG